MGETALVTVGSTLFDALIRAVDSLEVAEALKDRGYSKLIIQLGNGNHLPSTLLLAGRGSDAGSGQAENGLLVEWFRFTPTLAKHIETASLVISHAGSASTFESLRAGKALVSVPNPKLMANHQQELAEELAAQRFCIFSTPEDLPKALRAMDLNCLRPYTGGDPSHVANAIDRIICATPTESKRISIQRQYTVSLLGISLFLASSLLTYMWQH